MEARCIAMTGGNGREAVIRSLLDLVRVYPHCRRQRRWKLGPDWERQRIVCLVMVPPTKLISTTIRFWIAPAGFERLRAVAAWLWS